jgi:hypothetical protein
MYLLMNPISLITLAPMRVTGGSSENGYQYCERHRCVTPVIQYLYGGSVFME